MRKTCSALKRTGKNIIKCKGKVKLSHRIGMYNKVIDIYYCEAHQAEHEYRTNRDRITIAKINKKLFN